MIDLRAARSDADAYRAALARRGAAEQFDALLASDAAWRDASTRRDDVRAEQKRLGKPSTPEEIEEARRLKGELQTLDDRLATAERAAGALGPHPEPATRVRARRRGGRRARGASLRRAVGRRTREHTEIGRFDMERAARMSGSRFGYWIGDTALLALALYRFALDRLVGQGFVPVLPPVLVRERALYGTGYLPSADPNAYKLEGEDLYLAGTAEIRSGASTPTRSSRPTHYRSATSGSPRAFARRPARRRTRAGCSASTSSTRSSSSSSLGPRSRGTSTNGCSRTPKRSSPSSAFPTASSYWPQGTCPRCRRRHTTSSSGSRHTGGTARPPRSRTRPITRPGASARVTAPKATSSTSTC